MRMNDEWGCEDGETMRMPDEQTAVRHRLLVRQKGFLAGWRLLSEDVGDFEHHKGTMRMVVKMIREEGDDPARYEFRVDEAGPTPWNAGEIIAGETVDEGVRHE